MKRIKSVLAVAEVMAMMGGDGWGMGGGLMMLLFWGGLVVLVVFLVRGVGAPPYQGEKKSSAPDASARIA